MHEKTAVADRAKRQAGYGAEGVRNFAIAALYRNAEHFERQALEQGKDGATPYSDTPDELEVEIRDARLKDLKVREPNGNLWGVTATDEQGKINVTSAPDRVSVNARLSVSQRVVDLKDMLTIYSGRPARWVRPQKIREIGTITNPMDPSGTKLTGTRIDNAMQMGMGVRLRATKPGLPPFETKVVRNGVFFIGMHAVETDPQVPAKYLHGLLEIEMRHPVNLNTARRETLTALYEGLSISIPTAGGTGFKTYTLSSDEARTVASALYRKNIWTWHRFLDEVMAIDIDDNKKAAVIINALDPGNLLLDDRQEGRGSMGFCFTSNETITIEAFASVNTDAGTPQGGAGFREVVDLGCPAMLTRSWENQHDFDRMIGPPRLYVSTTGKFPILPKVLSDDLSLAGIFGTAYSGYPFGSRMETFPKDMDKGEASDMTLKSQQGKLANFISMNTERDYRGQGGIFRFVEHFDDELEGRKIDASSHPVEHAKAFAPQPLRADVASGGTEFWLRFDQAPGSVGVVKLFDIRESDNENRISIEVIGTEIVYRITDATYGLSARTVDKGWSEIRAPFAPTKDTWYHIAAYWKGTKYGHMILMIDGFVPSKAKWRHVDADNGLPMSTELSSPMSAPDPSTPVTSVPMKDSQSFQRPVDWPREEPYTVPLQIGDEVVEFDPSTGSGRRGARIADIVYGSTFQDHPIDAKVTVFGYNSPLKEISIALIYQPPAFDPPAELGMRFGPLPMTSGKCALRFGTPVATSVVGEETDPDGNPVVMASNTTIKFVISDQVQADIEDWPEMGFIKIENEAIFYQQLKREGPKAGAFEMCQRGMEMTLPQNHPTGANIELWSIAVTSKDTRISTPTIIQIKEEWFGPVTLANSPLGVPHSFWVGCLVQGRPVSIMRGLDWLTPLPAQIRFHEPEEPLCPVFAAREVDPNRRRTNLARYDSVTVLNADYEKESHIICRAISPEELNQYKFMMNPMGGNPPPPPREVAWQGVQLATMFSQTRYQYNVDNLHTRVLKFPSGELLDQRWLALKNPGVAYGPAKATIDEVKNLASMKGDFLLDRVAPAEVPELLVDNALLISGNQTSGIVVAGEEIIGYAKYDGAGGFKRCKRGWLNSPTQVHNDGDPVFLLNFLPVAAVGDQALEASARMFPITQVLAGQGYTKGYILVNDEVVGFEEVGVKGTDLDSLSTFEGTGLFRGMFGTTARNHQAHAMVFGIPFRYWDGYKRGQFDNRMPYFSVGHTTRDARWNELRYQIETGANDANLLPHGYLRVDGLGHFTVPTVDEHSAVWHFFKSQKNTLDEYVSSRLENGQIEARFFLEYKQGSYWPADSWKRTMKIHEVRIDYDRDSKVLMHEDK
ncbi:MAG TPA: hypothetical protein VJU16_05935, partial [Planctomycetota bacterium]|nr:hypothetical protein [Planctomycetota bacterium]